MPDCEERRAALVAETAHTRFFATYVQPYLPGSSITATWRRTVPASESAYVDYASLLGRIGGGRLPGKRVLTLLADIESGATVGVLLVSQLKDGDDPDTTLATSCATSPSRCCG